MVTMEKNINLPILVSKYLLRTIVWLNTHISLVCWFESLQDL